MYSIRLKTQRPRSVKCKRTLLSLSDYQHLKLFFDSNDLMQQSTIAHLGPGDFIFLSPGKDHTLSSHAPGEQHVQTDPGTLLMCGYCEFTGDDNHSVANLFPPTSIIRDEVLQQQSWLQSILSQLSSEYQSQQPGAQLAVNRLTEVLMVEI